MPGSPDLGLPNRDRLSNADWPYREWVNWHKESAVLAIEETRDSNQEPKDISLLNCRRVMDLKEKSNVGEAWVTRRLDAKGCGAVVKWLLPKLGAAWRLAGSTLHLHSDAKVERKEGRRL